MAMKVTYFNTRGKAELIRQLLVIGGDKFEDIRVHYDMDDTKNEWTQERKATMPLGQLPVLEVDGVKYPQTIAIARFLAEKYNLRGKTVLEKFEADVIVDTIVTDIMTVLVVPLIHSLLLHLDQNIVDERRENVQNNYPRFFKVLQNMIRGENTFLESGLSWADVALFNLINDSLSMTGVKVDETEFPKLIAISNNVKTHPKIAEWLKTRPATLMNL